MLHFVSFKSSPVVPWLSYSPLEPRFADSNSAGIEGFFQSVKILNGYIDGLLHILGTMYRWCVTTFSSSLWNISIPLEHVLDGRAIQSYVKIDALCELGGRPISIHRKNPYIYCTCCVTKEHWEPSACSRTQITCASG